QLRARLPGTVGPLCFLEMIWSISNGRSSYSWGNRQYSQQFPARCQTRRIIAASMERISGDLMFIWLDPERAAGPRLEDRQQVPGLAERQQLFLLLGGEGILLVPDRQVMHPRLVAVAEAPGEDMAGHRFGELPLFVAQDTGQDGDLVFDRACRHP